MSGPPLPNLPPKHAAILADTVDMTFKHPDSGKKCLIKRTQVPLVPAFAMTAHKAQGKSLEVVMMDLESTIGTESPYVMLSRATSLAGVFILRPFQKKVIQRHPSQDVRNEFRRVDMLYHQTIMQFGTTEEAGEAQKYLVSTFSAHALPSESTTDAMDIDIDVDGGARRLELLQATNDRLIAGGGATPIAGNFRATSLQAASTTSRSRARITKDSDVQSMDLGAKRPRNSSSDLEEYRPSAKRQRISRI
jgi:hypothetical protein